MKLFIIRFLIIAVLYMFFRFVFRQPEALLIAFVLEYIVEPLITSKI